MGIRGAVATPHLSATRAGERALAEGGSAVDAAIVAAAVLAVVAPDQCGLGGDAVALVGHGAGDVTCFQGAGRAAHGVDVEQVRRAGSGTMPVFGPHAVTVPGAVSTWAAMHRHAGRLPWDALFEPAREAAEDGFAVGARLHRAIEESQDRIFADPGLRALLLAEDHPL
ncbi:MAG: gamma-glutamyltransferase, partial [Actinomycetota bacterium]|nr:gamma-glutamyltransferase [Actinomycetota bacterium]